MGKFGIGAVLDLNLVPMFLVGMKWRGRGPRELSTLQTLAIYQQNMVDIFVFAKCQDKLLVQAK